MRPPLPLNRSRFFLKVCSWYFLVFGSNHIQNLQESQGWRQLRLYSRSFLVNCLWGVGPTGLRLSVGHSVCTGPCQFARLASVPVQALGVSALWLYILDGTMFFKASLRGPNEHPPSLDDSVQHIHDTHTHTPPHLAVPVHHIP